ncbi:dihydrodipicolinate synthase family protein [Petroclostridium sp. X23]|uniref:dihydrodipicolinate synthase family protein n=1 Tax=Petroclostridium sp. X23 TaxID=3045146 RepID=UPI0024ADD32D|nr:dihydrodipicolinate synthase family protein [Petroclostridium sp. X23]WHH59916.1 dihydrodipicolinate synthase family protein [Petroclostridium sp. X23]
MMNVSIKEKLSGVFPPIMTPFENEKVSYDKLADNIKKYNETNLRGYMPLGSNGEFRSLTDDESLKIIETIAKNRTADKVLMVGTGRESASATIEFTKKAADKGAEFASVLAPHYFINAMTDEALIKFFLIIADHSPIPVLVYNAPKFAAGLTISPKVIEVLSKHSNIVGMKDTSTEDIAIYINAVDKNEEFHVLAGSINKFYTGLLAGAVGGILSMANYLPELCNRLYEFYLADDKEQGEKYHNYLCDLNKKTGGKSGVAGVKAAMDVLGYFGGCPRIPLLPVDEEEKNAIRIFLESEGLLA